MPEKKKSNQPTRADLFIINLISRFGLPSTFFILLMVFARKEQYQEFIDTYILLKFSKNFSGFPIFILIYLVLGSGGTIFFLFQRMKIKDERIRTLENDLNKLQQTVTKTKGPKKSNTKV